MVFYFSGTGNSRWVAERVAEAFQEKLVAIGAYFVGGQPPVPAFDLNEHEHIGFVFPVHSWGIPPIVGKFIDRLQLNGYNGQQIYCIMTCGDECGYADRMLRKHFARHGWTCRHIYALQMPNNYICMKGFGTDSAELAAAKTARARQDLPRIIDCIRADRPAEMYCKSKHFAFLKSRIVYPLFAKFSLTDKPFHCTDACTSCGLCAKVCPVGNIALKNGQPQWQGNCTQCLACIHRCPATAIEYGKASVGQGRYYFKD